MLSGIGFRVEFGIPILISTLNPEQLPPQLPGTPAEAAQESDNFMVDHGDSGLKMG